MIIVSIVAHSIMLLSDAVKKQSDWNSENMVVDGMVFYIHIRVTWYLHKNEWKDF